MLAGMEQGTLYKIPVSVLVVIHSADLEILLLERADRPGYWQSVTGSRDAEDEALIETAIREVHEETGILVEPSSTAGDAAPWVVPAQNMLDWHHSIEYEIYAQWRARYAPGVTRNTEHWFSLRVPHRFGVRLSPREHLHSVWLPLEEAAQRCFSPSNRDAILELPERLRTIAKAQ